MTTLGIGIGIGTGLLGVSKSKLVVSDTFNRPDGSLGVADTGQVWSLLAGTLGIVSNAATRTAVTSPNVAAIESGHSNVDISVDMTWRANAGLVFRLSDQNNYFLTRIMSGLYQIYKIENSVTTKIGEYAMPTTLGTVYSLKVTASGDNILNYINGVLAISVQSSFNTSATMHGITTRTSDSGDTLDNFKVVAL